jgi:hypothetical protein
MSFHSRTDALVSHAAAAHSRTVRHNNDESGGTPSFGHAFTQFGAAT